MEWSRADVIGAVGLAVAIVAALAAALVIHDRKIRTALVVLLCALSLLGLVALCQRSPDRNPEPRPEVPLTDSSVVVPKPEPARAIVVPINEDVTNNVENFALTLTTVELHANGRTRWLLSARNGTSERHTIRLDYSATYVADDLGNRYAVTADSFNSALRDGMDAGMDPAIRLDYWIEFAERKAGGTTFTLHLVNGHFATVRFAPIEVRLPAAEGLGQGPAPAKPGVTTYAINQPVGSNIEDFTMTLENVDELANGHTRWHLTAFNRTNRNHTLRFNYSDTYCVDDDGNRYKVHGDSFNSNFNDGLDREIQPGVKLRFWIEFEPRQKTGKIFTLHLINGHFATVRLAPVQANLAAVPVR